MSWLLTSLAIKISKAEDVDIAALWCSGRAEADLTVHQFAGDGEGAGEEAEGEEGDEGGSHVCGFLRVLISKRVWV